MTQSGTEERLFDVDLPESLYRDDSSLPHIQDAPACATFMIASSTGSIAPLRGSNLPVRYLITRERHRHKSPGQSSAQLWVRKAADCISG